MIARHRLQGRGRFAAVRAHGTRASSGAIRITIAGNGLQVARVGFALVGLRSAVVRNRLRRRLREAVRPQLARLAGRDAIVLAGADAAGLPFGELRSAVVNAVDRVIARSPAATDGPTPDNGAMTTKVGTP